MTSLVVARAVVSISTSADMRTIQLAIEFNGKSLPGCIRIPITPNPSKCIIMLHGASSTHESSFLVDLAEHFVSKGDLVLGYTCRSNLVGRAKALQYVLGSLDTILKDASCTPVSNVVLLGHSMGSRVAVEALHFPEAESVDACVLMSYPLHPKGPSGDWRTMQSFVGTSTPFLMLVGTKDKFVNANTLTRSLEGILPESQYTLHSIPGGNHSLRHPSIPTLITDFLSTNTQP